MECDCVLSDDQNEIVQDVLQNRNTINDNQNINLSENLIQEGIQILLYNTIIEYN